jgi:hypothetical protein
MRKEPSARGNGAFAIAIVGVALVAAALALDAGWLDRHFLPSFFLPRRWYIRIHEIVRWTIALLGIVVVWRSRSIARRLTVRALLRALPIAAAAVLALGASELVLQRVHLRPGEWLLPDEEPRRQPDARLGWTLVPARTGVRAVAGRTIEYAIDAAGYRVRRVDEPVDPTRPTVVFTGESVMFGEGLTWEESVPAQVGARLGVQSANLAVHGYSTDQAFLRLQTELPRFHQPIAVVTLFMTALFGRNLDDDRPHLDPELTWMPAQAHGRLMSLAGLVVPYRRDETVERGVMVTREVLQATVDLVRGCGATPLVVVPQFGVEEPIEAQLRRRILDAAGVPYVLVAIDSDWRLPWDRHPNARAAARIADAIANRLRANVRVPNDQLSSRPNSG